MLSQLKAANEEKRDLIEEGERKDRIIQQKESQISLLGEEIQARRKQALVEIDQSKLAHSREVEQLQLQLRDLNTQYNLLKDENKAEISELKSKVAALERESNRLMDDNYHSLQSDLSNSRSQTANL